MDDGPKGGSDSSAAEELILRTVAAHADSLLRTARRHSICVDDAQDAYQRTLEIFMLHAARLEPEQAPGWLHVVVKREAQAIRRSRQKLVAASDIDLDQHESGCLPTADERLMNFDMVNRAAEALQRLKPQELRALWLKAQGHSYNDIGAITGWSYTKVNRCLTEGRRSFLDRYAGIESGAECLHWLPVISAMVDGEAAPEQILELRPHLRNCPGCRATLKALQDSSPHISALLPIPLLAIDANTGAHLPDLFMRVYELVAGGLHERAVHSFTKVQALLEVSTTGKVAAVAASAAAVAGGGYATVEKTVDRGREDRPAKASQSKVGSPNTGAASPSRPRARLSERMPAPKSADAAAREVNEFSESSSRVTSRAAPEFRARDQSATVRLSRSTATSTAQRTSRRASPVVAPEFSPRKPHDEFTP